MKFVHYKATRGDVEGSFFVANGQITSWAPLLDGLVGNQSRKETVRTLREQGFTVRRIGVFDGILLQDQGKE